MFVIDKLRSKGLIYIPETLYILSILGIMVPSASDISIITLWREMSLPNYLRLFSAIGLTTFFPGYFIISMLTKYSKNTDFPFIETIGPSFLLSLMLSTCLAFIMFYIQASFFHSILAFILVNVAISLIHCSQRRFMKHARGFTVKTILRLRKEHIPLLITILFFLITDLVLHFSLNNILVGGDMVTFTSGAISVLRRKYPIYETSVIQDFAGTVSYPYFYFDYLACFLLLSGAPPMNAVLALLPIFRVAFIITFYQMVHAFFKDDRVASLSTLFTFLFGGFVWLAAMFRSTNDLTKFFDVLSAANVLMARFPIFVDLIFGLRSFQPGIVSLFVLGYVFRKDSISGLLRNLMIISAVSVGYLMHQIGVIVFFLCLSPLIVLFADKESLGHLRICVIYSLATLLAIAMFDISVPFRFYTLQIQFWLTLAAIGITLLLILVRLNVPSFNKYMSLFSNACHQTRSKLLEVTKLIVASSILYLYIISFLFWFDSPIMSDYYMLVPWYFYTIKFGVTGLLAMGSVIYLLVKKPDKNILFFALYTAVAFFISKIATAVMGLYYYFSEFRFMFYIFLGASIVGASFLSRITSNILDIKPCTKKRRLLFCLLLTVISISGISESTLAVGYMKSSGMWQVPYEVTANELDAINFLRFNRPLNEYVAILGDNAWVSRAHVILSGAKENYLPLSEQLFLEQDPETTFRFLNYWNVRYIYFTQRDSELINLYEPEFRENFVIKDLLKYLPVAFENDYVKLYEIPRGMKVSGKGSLAMPTSFYLLSTVALSGIDYSEYFGSDYKLFSTNSTIFLDDFAIYYIPIGRLTWETRNGAHLELELNTVNITFQSEVEGKNWPGALARIDSLQLDRESSILFFNYKTDPLPSEARWYYFEILDSEFKRIFASELPPSTSGFDLQYYKIPDISKAKWLWIGMDTLAKPESPPKLQLREAGFLKLQIAIKEPSILRMMNLNISDFIDVVRKGGSLIVFGSERGLFAEYLSIYPLEKVVVNGATGHGLNVSFSQIEITKTFSNDSDVEVLSVFTKDGQVAAPLAYVKSVGAGKIIYLEVSSYLRAIENATDEAFSSNLFPTLIAFFKMIEHELPSDSVSRPEGIYAFLAPPLFTGHVAVETEFLKIVERREIHDMSTIRRVLKHHEPFRVSFLKVSNESVSEKGTSMSFTNVFIKELQFKLGVSKIFASNLTFIESFGGYNLLSVQGPFKIIMSGKLDEQIVVEGEEKGVQEIYVNDGTVELIEPNASSLLLLVRSPKIIAQGDIFFPWATIWNVRSTESDVIAVAWKSPVQISGQVSLEIDHGGTFIHAKNFEINGSLEAERQLEWWVLEKSLVGADMIPFQAFQVKHLLPIPFLIAFYSWYFYSKKRYRNSIVNFRFQKSVHYGVKVSKDVFM